jgi:hypothetical protein
MAILPAIDRDLQRPLSIDKKSTVIRPTAWLKWLLLLLPGFWASRTAQVRCTYKAGPLSPLYHTHGALVFKTRKAFLFDVNIGKPVATMHVFIQQHWLCTVIIVSRDTN